MAFLNLASELAGRLPGLSPLLAPTFINRALEAIYQEYRWSFLQTDGELVCPTQITSGLAAITQYSPTVTLDATASAALLAQTVIGAVPGLQNMQIRFGAVGGTPALGLLYSIIDFDATNPAAIILTLDRVVVEGTSSGVNYQCYRAYVTPPLDDFQKWESIVDPVNAIWITGNRLTYTSVQIDGRDPQRLCVGLAYLLASWGANRISNAVTGATVPNALSPQSTPIYELWPHPTSGQTFYCRIKRKGTLFVQPTDEQPDGISDELIIQRALYSQAYPFAAANAANNPSFKGVIWPTLIAQAAGEYGRLLQLAKITDNEKQESNVLSRGHGLRDGRGGFKGDWMYPIDSNFLQSHLIRW